MFTTKLVLLWLFVVIQVARTQPQDKINIVGYIDEFSAVAWRNIRFLYQYRDDSVSLTVSSRRPNDSIDALSKRTIDFATGDVGGFNATDGIVVYPLIGMAIVMNYKTIGSLGANSPRLVLDVNAIRGIYSNNITQWDDPYILELNPEIADLLHGNITVAYRSDENALNTAFTRAIGLPVSSKPSFPGRTVTASNARALAAVIAATPGAIGFMVKGQDLYSLSFASHERDLYKLMSSDMINPAGNRVTAGHLSVLSAMEEFLPLTDGHSITVDLLSGIKSNTWPMTVLSYVMMNQDTHRSDEAIKAWMQVLFWAVTNPRVQDVFDNYGYSTPHVGLRKKVSDHWWKVSVDGSRALVTSTTLGAGNSAVRTCILAWVNQHNLAFTMLNRDYEQMINDSLNENIEFAISMVPPFPGHLPDSFLVFPALLVGVSFIYNIPGLPSDQRLTLSLDVVAKILLGEVTHWNDPSIVAINRHNDFSEHPITLVIRDHTSVDEPTGLNYVLTRALSRVRPEIPVSLYPEFTALSNRTILVSTAIELKSMVNATEYSLALIGVGEGLIDADNLPDEDLIATNKRVFGDDPEINFPAYADFINAEGHVVRVSPESIKAASLANGPTNSDIINAPGNDSWPLAAYAFEIVNTDFSRGDCLKLSNIISGYISTQLIPDFGVKARRYGYELPPPEMTRALMIRVRELQCGDVYAFSSGLCVHPSTGYICSDHGTCVDQTCECDSGYEGTWCEDETPDDSDKTATLIGVFLGVFVPLIVLVVACVIVLIIIIVIIPKSRKEYDSSWNVDFEEIALKKQIGSGGFGVVHRAEWKNNEVAVKVLNTQNVTASMREFFIDEVKAMTALRHPNVVLFMGACTKPPHLAIIMELMALGSLYDLLHNKLVPVLPYTLQVKISLQAAKGVEFLHNSGIIHADLKSANLLIDEQWRVKVSDFGLTRFKQKTGIAHQEIKGSLFWMAPEILAEESPPSEETDVYSFGIILWEILLRRDPYEGINPTAVAVGVIRDGLRPNMSLDVPPDMRLLVQDCWDGDPHARPSFGEIVTRLKGMAADLSGVQTSSTDGATKGSNSTSGSSTKFAVFNDAIAPQGTVTIAFSDIANANDLWEHNAELMSEATMLHNSIVRESIKEFSGYEVPLNKDWGTHTGEGYFCVAFQHAHDAARWAISVQHRLLCAPWDPELCKHSSAAEETAGEDDVVVFRGLRVRMGLHTGTVKSIRDPITRSIEYFGSTVNRAARITMLAKGGQVLTSSVFKRLMEQDLELHIKYIGKHALQKTARPEKIYELKSPQLMGRYFAEAVMSNYDGDSSCSDKSISGSGSSVDDDLDDIDAVQEEGLLAMASANMCRWVIPYDELKIGDQIGMGGYGVVYKARWKGVGVAVKKLIKQTPLDESMLLGFRAEVAFLSQLHHPNIVLFIGACVKPPNLCIVTEFVKMGSLNTILADKKIGLKWKQKMKIAHSAALGLNYLHALQPVILHRDLKSSNIMLEETFNAKIIDFGFARIKQENATMTRCGSPCWTAPEIIRGEKYTEKADVYSFGIILWELLTRQQPYKGRNFMGVGMEVLEGLRPAIPDDCPKPYARLLRKCWHRDYKKRPSMPDVVAFFDSDDIDYEDIV
jgi:serine/threonine protein kinase/ABC-type phosphate transport system substrate-binding protein